MLLSRHPASTRTARASAGRGSVRLMGVGRVMQWWASGWELVQFARPRNEGGPFCRAAAPSRPSGCRGRSLLLERADELHQALDVVVRELVGEGLHLLLAGRVLEALLDLLGGLLVGEFGLVLGVRHALDLGHPPGLGVPGPVGPVAGCAVLGPVVLGVGSEPWGGAGEEGGGGECWDD